MVRARRYGEPRARCTSDRQWPIRIDAGELGSFELRADEATNLAAELANAVTEYRRRNNRRRTT